MHARMRPIQPKEDEILEVVSESACTNTKVVTRDGRQWALKFIYANGATLYVPLPSTGDDEFLSATAGPMRS